ncbi:hypothetical protein HK405_007419 [Cladochytrium tenue]|nr:hypothetical protein HK405_007419 [Cladochytrium tenue]
MALSALRTRRLARALLLASLLLSAVVTTALLFIPHPLVIDRAADLPELFPGYDGRAAEEPPSRPPLSSASAVNVDDAHAINPPPPAAYLSAALASWPTEGICEVHHNGAFFNADAVAACVPGRKTPSSVPPAEAYLDRLAKFFADATEKNKIKSKKISGEAPVQPLRTFYLANSTSHNPLDAHWKGADLWLELIVDGESGRATLPAASAHIDCVTLEESLPERLCRTRNVAVRVSRVQRDGGAKLTTGSMEAGCDLDGDWWFGNRQFGNGAAKSLFEGLHIIDNQASDVACDAYISTPLYLVDRWDTTNPFQAHHDLVNAFVAYSTFGVDPHAVQPVLLDALPRDGPFLAAWSRVFATDRAVLDLPALFHEDGLVRPRPLPRSSSTTADRVVCLRDALWSVHGGISPLSRGGARRGRCSTSSLLLAFRSFVLDRVRRTVLGPALWRRPRTDDPPLPTDVLPPLHDWRAATAAGVPLPVPAAVAFESEAQTIQAVRDFVALRVSNDSATADPTALAARVAELSAKVTPEAADSLGPGRPSLPPAWPPTLTITYAVRNSSGPAAPLAGPLRDLPVFPWPHSTATASSDDDTTFLRGPHDHRAPLPAGSALDPLPPISRRVGNEPEAIAAIRTAAREWEADAAARRQQALLSLAAGEDAPPDGGKAPRQLPPPAPRVEVRAVDFAELPIEEQMGVAQGTDLFVGPHGAVFAHLLYLRTAPVAGVLELKPPQRRGGNYQFMNLASMLRHRYRDVPIDKTVSKLQLETIQSSIKLLLSDLWDARQAAA